MKPDIELHIDKLVLHGINPADRRQLGEAVERELARLLSERGFPMGFDRDVHIDRLDGGRITISAAGRPETVGVEIARSLHEVLNRK